MLGRVLLLLCFARQVASAGARFRRCRRRLRPLSPRTSRRSRLLVVGDLLHHLVASAARPARCVLPPQNALRRRLLTPGNRGCPGLPGFTRSTYQPDHALITPESRVYAPLLGWCARESHK